MVRVEVGGKPIIDIDYEKGDAARIRDNVRRKIRGSRRIQFHWDNIQPRLVITSDTTDFDEEIIHQFWDEGFQITYLPYAGDHKDYENQLKHLADGLDVGDKYALIAYGDAASHCIKACMKPMPKLVALVVYYPPYLPQLNNGFPSALAVQIHLAATQRFPVRFPVHRYPDTKPGFAEHDLDEYDKTAARIAWSRTLDVLRNSFGISVDLEKIWDNHTRLEFDEKDADATMKTMVGEPYVNHVPTMTGGIGAKDLRRFYAEFFIPKNPPDLRIKLLSRTVGADRVVDEMLCTFTHTTEIPWMLPGVPPTGKKVEVALVSVVCIRGDKLYHEHIHWDQATVLLQIGLLDPAYIPGNFTTIEKGKEKEVKRLPVIGAEGARKVVDETVGKSNELVPDW